MSIATHLVFGHLYSSIYTSSSIAHTYIQTDTHNRPHPPIHNAKGRRSPRRHPRRYLHFNVHLYMVVVPTTLEEGRQGRPGRVGRGAQTARCQGDRARGTAAGGTGRWICATCIHGGETTTAKTNLCSACYCLLRDYEEEYGR